MTRRRDLERELGALSDIRNILDAMRNLALLETRKIERFLGAHERALGTTAAALADLGAFHAPSRSQPAPIRVLVLLGSERGLCGDFNEALLRALQERRSTYGAHPALIAVGSRLFSRLGNDPDLALTRAGASIAEDVDALIPQLARGLADILRQRRMTGFDLEALFHAPGGAGIEAMRLSPFPEIASPAAARNPPRIHLPPAELLTELSERYLVSRLQGLLYGSLLAENEHRLRHMDSAIRKLEDNSAGLRSRRNRLRQEEITEEIEIIMLSSEKLEHEHA
ncbi:MAG: F0F1 ATP synthase subunit gamma [Betaproteobacteria bacterium]|nr:MAG: F0F1 ATP synthase subunit gamma [Betaproteobacteria bacterium]